MIQDIMPHHFDNQYIPQKPKEESFVLLYDEGKTLIRKENENISFVKRGKRGSESDRITVDIFIFH